MERLTYEQLVAKYQEVLISQPLRVLDGIDAVDWAVLKDAYGSAKDIPALLRASLSVDKWEREFAFELLFERICHQGSVYSASASAIPFLFKMLQSPETPDQSSVASLLAGIAMGTSRDSWAAVTREAVGKRLDLLYPFLQDDDKHIRSIIGWLLKRYPERSPETLPLLEEQLTAETDVYVKRQIEETIQRLKAGQS